MSIFRPALLLALVVPVASQAADVDYPVRPVPFTQVQLKDGFWGPRLTTNREVTVGYDFRKCEETGRIDNFAKAGGLMKGPFRGIYFDDSDVFKVVEGASYTLALHPDPKLDQYLDNLIAKIAAAQEDDGYLYTYRTLKAGGSAGPARWTNLASSHELYNMGHLYEAAVAHYLATGKRSLLDVALKNAELIYKTFGPADDQRKDPPGHQEIEIGLAKLYRTTNDKRWLDLAKFFLDVRGKSLGGRKLYGPYAQDDQPVVEQRHAHGHSVRATYMYSGMADVAALTGDSSYVAAIDRIWQDVVGSKLYITGGIGARHHGEAFGDPYELPNREAYNETCAAIANCLWNHRMFLLHGDASYMDVFERTLYNAFLAGVSQQGDTFFYPNPLAADGKWGFNHGNRGRAPWFDCSCCPVNVVRFFPSIAGCVYAQRDKSLYVNLYATGEARLKLGAQEIVLTQSTNYPWNGNVRFDLQAGKPARFALRLRIPGWARGETVPSDLYHYLNAEPVAWTITVNGEKLTAPVEQGFATIEREWKSGDRVVLELPMPVRRVLANEKVAVDRGRVAIERGPLVYCAEGVDHDGQVNDLVLADNVLLKPEGLSSELGGITVIEGDTSKLVRTASGTEEAQPFALTLIPYYAWAHRGVSTMEVWLARDAAHAVARPLPTLASRAKASASHVWQNDTVDAVNDQLDPQTSADTSIPRLTFWDHRGTQEWVQLDLDKPALVSAVDVYWFDDTGRGECRVPANWRLLYRDGEAWKPVDAKAGFAVAKDTFNQSEFTPVTTDALRIEVQLQPNLSGGILEWRVQ